MKKNKGIKRAPINSRKTQRKEKRKLKKIHRQEHYLKKKNETSSIGRFVMRPEENNDSVAVHKKRKPKQQTTIHEIINNERKKELNQTEKLKLQMDEQRKKIFLKANEDEDKMIKKLEKQLGLNKSKNKNNYFADDGLDYLLEICDRATSEQIVAAEKHLADVEKDSDFEEDLAAVTGKELVKSKKSKKNIEESYIDEASDDDLSNESEDESDSNREESDQNSEIDESNENDSDSQNSDTDIKKPISIRRQINEDDEIDEEDGYESKDSVSNHNIIQNQKKIVNSQAKKLKDKQSLSNKKIKIVSEDDVGNVFSDDEISHLSGDDTDLDSDVMDGDDDGKETEKSKEKPDIWEDIYGRKRDKDGNVIKEEKGVYIPPHLRNKDTGSDKELAQLKRQIKSVLNKLAGTNLHWACTSIENLYQSNSRNSVNSALTQLWLEATVGVASTPDRLIAEHAALVSVLHANVGSEIGAHFLEVLSKQFDELVRDSQPMEDKHLDNLVSCLAHLYGFKIYHPSLLYDILSELTSDLTEKHIDCVLRALRAVGGTLRKEEPTALKNFIHDTQTKITGLNEHTDTGSRVKFLAEVLLAVKNNNLSKIPGYDPSYLEQLKKTSRGVVRRGNYVTPLNIRLHDLLLAHERGKWWVVGSAWEGGREQRADKTVPAHDHKLLELARQQRMNTDMRRNIFCIIMSAEDYMDAFEKLQHLGLRGQQEREIVHVLMACCLQEKKYNPYYAVLGQKLCDTDRKYQLSIQYSVWDKIKEMDSMPKQCMNNLAQFLIHLIMEKGLPLSVLKIIQFSDLNKRTVRFMRRILLAVIMNEDIQASLEVFHRISKPPKLHMFRESLRLFIQHFLIKNVGKSSGVLTEDEMATLKMRSVEVDKVLQSHKDLSHAFV
ncbi:nucleolar MIF4G domain-containing protein 1 homolog [Leptidea sinapis]|uniref:nucleolar MIF4G domain-containing protein 1 homolog n=1 Tax=Leptidea sinapis TaxID=189913 RepID=UPI0021C343E8|nr:nucleolar MIF4G domain-containing protein 1 homolog [Leptidea sinapis]